MVVAVTSSHTIVPRYSTPMGYMNLSELDQVQTPTHMAVYYLFKPTHNLTATMLLETMKTSLSLILVHYYPLAGRLHKIEGDRFQLQCNATGVKLLEAKSELKMADYGDFAPTKAFIEEFYPKCNYNTPIESWPLLLVQATRFSCGGVCVVVAVSHVVLDGWSVFQFVNSWAKLARGECMARNEVPVYERTNLLPCRPVPPPRFDHKEYKAPPLLLGCSDAKTERDRETRTTILKLAKQQVDKLKEEAAYESSKGPYSTYEAVAAHMWKSACRARRGGGDVCHQTTAVRVVANIRNKLKPPLPLNYAGNGIHRILTPTCFYGDILSKPLSYAAYKIREAIEMLTDGYIRSAIDFVAPQELVDWLRVRSKEAHFYGNPNLNIGSFLHMPIYDADFGWGKPIYVGATLSDDGKAFIAPTAAGDGSVIISLRLQTRHMDAFNKFFWEGFAVNPEHQLGQLCRARL